MYSRKISTKILLNNWFFVILDFDKKTCIFTGKTLAGLEKSGKKGLGTTVFSSFLVFDKTNLDFDRNFFGKFVESAFYVSKETVTEQRFRKEFQKISGFLDFEKVFGTMARNFLEGCQKFNRCPEEQLEGKIPGIKFFRLLSNSYFYFEQKIFYRETKPAINSGKTSIKREKFTILISLGFWAKPFLFKFSEKIRQNFGIFDLLA